MRLRQIREIYELKMQNKQKITRKRKASKTDGKRVARITDISA